MKDGVFADTTMEMDGRMVSNPTDEMLRKAGYEPYVPSDSELLAQAKQAKTQEIEAYDTSTDVNGFQLNGNTVWLDKDTRMGLMNSTTIAKNMGQESTTVWFGGISMTIPCDTAIQMLSALEMYALECFNVTARHKANVAALTSVSEVEAYDYKGGYPSKLDLAV